MIRLRVADPYVARIGLYLEDAVALDREVEARSSGVAWSKVAEVVLALADGHLLVET
jgi:hypothetical protein